MLYLYYIMFYVYIYVYVHLYVYKHYFTKIDAARIFHFSFGCQWWNTGFSTLTFELNTFEKDMAVPKTTCEILFDNNPEKFYWAGATVKGTVILNLFKEKLVRGIWKDTISLVNYSFFVSRYFFFFLHSQMEILIFWPEINRGTFTLFLLCCWFFYRSTSISKFYLELSGRELSNTLNLDVENFSLLIKLYTVLK